ncbi:MAG TPA: GNAT family N-acetyltransferase, partial [Chitinophagales bacterium]|nr:GNAT family N-acetyltransferase [Chitinophagales bacterium]
QILALNSKYLINHLSDTEKLNGFIRIEYDREDIEKIIDHKEIVIATVNEKVVGYYLVGKRSEKIELEQQKVMSLILHDSGKFEYKRIGFGCQVCIDKAFRNNGLFGQMLIELVNALSEKYTHLLCTISDDNNISMKTHLKNGWKLMDEFEVVKYFIYNTQKPIL